MADRLTDTSDRKGNAMAKGRAFGRAKKLVLAIGLLLIVASVVFPPMVNSYGASNHYFLRSQNSPITVLFSPLKTHARTSVDYHLLLLEWAAIAAATGAVYLILAVFSRGDQD